MPAEKPQWKELYEEVVLSGLCTGCSACIIACPHDVLKYNYDNYKPFHVPEDGGERDCTHGQRGCTLCSRACPRFRDWEAEADSYLFGRVRQESELAGQMKEVILAKATDEAVNDSGQDGGFVSACLIYALENDIIDCALVSRFDKDSLKAFPTVATNREEVLQAAGSRYTYSANTLAYFDAINRGFERICLVGMSCQASIPAVMSARKTGKSARRLSLSIGLLCSKTFDDAIYDEFFGEKYGIEKSNIAKINIKGVFQTWLKDGSYVEIPLKEGRAWTREGCKMCPDFAAEHADLSVGGIGKFSDYSLVIIRTEKGRSLVDKMVAYGVIEKRPISDDQDVLGLLNKLSRASRKRWPDISYSGPKLGVG